MNTAPDRVPTGVVDEELRVVVHTDEAVPRLEIQPWHYSLTTGGWSPAEGPAALQVQFVERLCEVLRQLAGATGRGRA